jgi:hypothetical protein
MRQRAPERTVRISPDSVGLVPRWGSIATARARTPTIMEYRDIS